MARVLVGSAVAAAIGIPAGAGTAQAGPLDLECAGSQTTTYSPGLTLIPTEQTVNSHVIYGPCVSASNPAVSTGERTVINHQTLSCLEIATAGSGMTTIAWNTGQHSVFTFNRTVTHAGGNTIVTLTGAITSGLFAGDSAVEIVVGPSLDTLKCLTPPGVTSRPGVTTLTITST